MLYQLDEAKKTRGERVEDGTAQRDRPLFEVPFLFHALSTNLLISYSDFNSMFLIYLVSKVQVLKENKDKRDAEFNERFKHSEFLTACKSFSSSSSS